MKVALLELFANPVSAVVLSPATWDVVIPQARATGLLGSLGELLVEYKLLAAVPQEVRRHLESEMLNHEKQRQSLDYELKWLLRAMDEVGERLLLLKGAAYIVAGLPAGAGRLISDIDMLVPARSLRDVEQVMARYGWMPAPMDVADERYYRKWMHEIPPMAHRDRGSVLDIHHTILPPTSDASFDPARLFEAVVEVRPGVYMLSPEDMVIHSATHLFHEGEFRHGLRDLLDLHRLLNHYGANDVGFWNRLIPRARELDMLRPLYYALRYSSRIFGTKIPHEVSAEIEDGRPRLPGLKWMDALFLRAFMPDHATCRQPFTAPAHFCLYVRSHYLRMPLYLLIPHLLRKLVKGVFGGDSPAEGLELGGGNA